MDYVLGEIRITIENFRSRDLKLEQYYRFLIYYFRINDMLYGKKENSLCVNESLKQFWDKESNLEKRIYRKLKKWEERHPIISIIICTILLGILISLLAGVILEAIY